MVISIPSHPRRLFSILQHLLSQWAKSSCYSSSDRASLPHGTTRAWELSPLQTCLLLPLLSAASASKDWFWEAHAKKLVNFSEKLHWKYRSHHQMVPFMIVKERLVDRPTIDVKKICLACNHISFLLGEKKKTNLKTEAWNNNEITIFYLF